MKRILFLLLAASQASFGQELYPYAEPASNMPAYSIAIKNTAQFFNEVKSDNKTVHRQMPEVFFGLTKSWMIHAGASFSNWSRSRFGFDGVRLYAKHRFLSKDGLHQHFRMALFTVASYNPHSSDENEINLMMAEQSGVGAGLIATQLWNKFALSATGGWNEVLSGDRWSKTASENHAYQAFTYSLSAGYLLFPVQYKSYDQVNINLYTELIGSRNINFNSERYFIDVAPVAQAIFKSTAKLSAGYRFQLGSDINRLTKSSWNISFEYLFLNALRHQP